MSVRFATIAALIAGAAAVPAAADPGDQWREQWKIRAACDKKLDEAKSRREFYKELGECNKKLAEWRGKQREEAAKAWAEAEKKWHERHRGDWDD